jgi:hypothetical protein
VSDDDQLLPQDSGSTFGHLRPATPTQIAYRTFYNHSLACPDCGFGKTRCDKAEELWRAYKNAQEKRP